MNRSASRLMRRHGVTLIELLLVIGIMVMLLSIAIPVVQLGLQDKKQREAARQLNAMVSLAKARAAERGRPVGLWFDRPIDRVNECLQVFLAEVPLPYSGDAFGARAYVRRSPNLPAPYQGYWQVIFDAGNCGSMNNARNLVGLNDKFLIRLNFKGSYFLVQRLATTSGGAPNTDVFVLIATPASTIPAMGCWLPWDPNNASDMGWGKGGQDDDSDMATDEIDEMGWPDTMIGGTPPNDTHDTPVGLPFQVYLNPRKLSSQTLDMPGGTAIDLSVSGISASGSEFDGWRLGAAADGSPVVVTFAPGGQVERVYYGGTFVEPLGTLYFFIGRSEQVQAVAAGSTGSLPNPKTNDNNLADPACFWVAINPTHGTVTTAENYWDPANPTLDVCRRIARTGQTKGGGP